MALRLLFATTMRENAGRNVPGTPVRRRSVSIVIPVYNRVDLTVQCLEAIGQTTSGDFEVVVVDDASTDGTADVLAQFGSALTVVRHDANHGFARACNDGARAARGDLLVFLNNDTQPRPGWLEALIAAADAAPDVGAVGARLLYPDGTIQHAGIGFTPDFEPFHLHQGVPADAPAVTEDRDCEALTGACLLVPRSVYAEIGGFDEGYRMYFEDIDLCLRIRATGRRVRYAAGSVVVHLERASSPTFAQAYAANRVSRERFRARWVTAAHGAAVAPVGRPARAPLRVLFQARDTLVSHRGGDTVVVERLMQSLAARGVEVRLGDDGESPAGYDVVHAINFATPEITRGIAERAEAARKPLVVTALAEDWPRFYRLAHATASFFMASVGTHGGPLDQDAFRRFLDRVRSEPSAAAPDNQVTCAIARVVLACGASERQRLLDGYPSLRDVRVVHFGSDLPVAAEPAAPDAFAAAHGVRDYVLCVARLEPRKNQLMLLEALRDDPRPVVLVGGDFTYAPRYAELCRRFGRRGPTLVLGRLPTAMLAAALREAAVHCLPSWYELPGLVSLEAARAGARVVASSWGALHDYLGDTIDYCEPDDPASVAAAVGAALRRSPDAATARAAAFTWETTAAATLAIYEEIAGGACVAPSAGAALDTTPRAVSWVATPAVPPPAAGSIRRAEPRAAVPPDDALVAAEDARAAGDFPAVLHHTERALADGADPMRIAELRALALVQLRRFDEAREGLIGLLASAAHARRAAFGLGVIALERAEPAAAEPWLVRATVGDADADAWATLGLCRSRLAETDGAWAAFAAARARDPGHRTALHGLITIAIESTERLGELETHLRDYLSHVEDDPDVRHALASCLYASGRDAESRAVVNDVLRAVPGHAQARALADRLSA
jgi:GT2 family glycosyltransferase/tetratricopeptide (TPR) repeat protein